MLIYVFAGIVRNWPKEELANLEIRLRMTMTPLSLAFGERSRINWILWPANIWVNCSRQRMSSIFYIFQSIEAARHVHLSYCLMSLERGFSRMEHNVLYWHYLQRLLKTNSCCHSPLKTTAATCQSGVSKTRVNEVVDCLESQQPANIHGKLISFAFHFLLFPISEHEICDFHLKPHFNRAIRKPWNGENPLWSVGPV